MQSLDGGLAFGHGSGMEAEITVCPYSTAALTKYAIQLTLRMMCQTELCARMPAVERVRYTNSGTEAR